MFRDLLLVGLLAGVIAGSLLSVLQYFSVLPIIREAERYENQITVSGMPDHGHEQGSPEWQPAEGGERLGFTWLANMAVASGFGLIMAGLMGVRKPSDWIHAIIFGLSGYYAFFLAPAVLLTPELPGVDTPDLQSRQLEWFSIVLLSLAGIGAMASSTRVPLRMIGVTLLIAPFVLIGRHEPEYSVPVPADLKSVFALMTGFSNLIFWLSLGLLTFSIRKYFDPSSE